MKAVVPCVFLLAGVADAQYYKGSCQHLVEGKVTSEEPGQVQVTFNLGSNGSFLSVSFQVGDARSMHMAGGFGKPVPSACQSKPYCPEYSDPKYLGIAYSSPLLSKAETTGATATYAYNDRVLLLVLEDGKTIKVSYPRALVQGERIVCTAQLQPEAKPKVKHQRT